VNQKPSEKRDFEFGQEQAFLLRSWQDNQGSWRFNLQTVQDSSKRVGFPNLDELLSYLRATFPPSE
jgi:hypothetical protein